MPSSRGSSWPGDLPDPRIWPTSLMSAALTGRFFTTRAMWEALSYIIYMHTHTHTHTHRASLVAQTVKNLPAKKKKKKNLPAMRGTWVRSLGQEDPLEKEMATRSSILAWRIPWTEKPGGLQSTGSQRVGHDWATSLYIHTFFFIMI